MDTVLKLKIIGWLIIFALLVANVAAVLYTGHRIESAITSLPSPPDVQDVHITGDVVPVHVENSDNDRVPVTTETEEEKDQQFMDNLKNAASQPRSASTD